MVDPKAIVVVEQAEGRVFLLAVESVAIIRRRVTQSWHLHTKWTTEPHPKGRCPVGIWVKKPRSGRVSKPALKKVGSYTVAMPLFCATTVLRSLMTAMTLPRWLLISKALLPMSCFLVVVVTAQLLHHSISGLKIPILLLPYKCCAGQ